MKESVIVFPPHTIPPEVLITADLRDTINEKRIQTQGGEGKKISVFSDVVINLAISPVLDMVLTTH